MAEIQVLDDECEGERGKRGKRGERGERGERGKRGHHGATGATGATGPTGPTAVPARTLFVSTSWPAGSNPAIYFTSIAAAYAASIALNPSTGNPVEILVYPGVYADPISVVSNVHLVGAGQQRTVLVTGAVTWTPGAGVNASQAANSEELNVAFITFTQPWLIDSTAKTAGGTGPAFRGVSLSGINYQGNTLGIDTAFIFASVLAGTYTFNNVDDIALYATEAEGPLLFTGSTFFNIAGGTVTALVTLAGGSDGFITGIAAFGGATVGAGCLLEIAGCNIVAPVTVAATGSADVRGSNYNGNTNLVGPGPIDRTTYTMSVTTTIAGANPIVFPVPYQDNGFNVNLQLTAGPGNVVTVTNKTPTGFTINDPVGGNTYDVSVMHD